MDTIALVAALPAPTSASWRTRSSRRRLASRHGRGHSRTTRRLGGLLRRRRRRRRRARGAGRARGGRRRCALAPHRQCGPRLAASCSSSAARERGDRHVGCSAADRHGGPARRRVAACRPGRYAAVRAARRPGVRVSLDDGNAVDDLELSTVDLYVPTATCSRRGSVRISTRPCARRGAPEPAPSWQRPDRMAPTSSTATVTAW